MDVAVDEVNEICTDFQIVHHTALRLGDRATKTRPQITAGAKVKYRRIQRTDFSVMLNKSRVRTARGKVASLLPESYGGKQPKIVTPDVDKTAKKRGRPRKIAPPASSEPMLFDPEDFQPA